MRNKSKARVIAEEWEPIAYCDERQVAHDSILDDLRGAEILMAAYDCEHYEGAAMVVYMKGGVLFEVNGEHGSCRGLEGQWRPEATTLAILKMRNPWYKRIGAELRRIVKLLERRERAAQKRRDTLQEMADGA